MKSVTKDGDPTGIPRRRNPSVNSTGVGSEGFSLLDLVEKVAIALMMLVARPGLVFVIVGIGDVPLVEVNLHPRLHIPYCQRNIINTTIGHHLPWRYSRVQ
jgi:hypothetical protein